MSRESYKGYVIEAAPHQLADDGRWTINVNIERHEDNRIDVSPYSAANTFETQEEASQHCIIFGRQIVDGKVAGCSAP